MTIDIEKLAGILREAARAEILPRFRNLSAGEIREKSSPTDLVTEADEAAERFIAAECATLAPDALFVGEESVAADPTLLERLDEAEWAIVVDPVDGTSNFAAGIPVFATMASVVRRGEAVGGVILDPLGDDVMLAERGAGAVQISAAGDRRRLKVADPVPLPESIACISATYFSPTERAALLPRLQVLKIFANYRCAGHEYRLLASGGSHLSAYARIMPWDHLAGGLIVSEAGGAVLKADGTPYRANERHGTLLSACGAGFWKTARDALFPQ